MNVSLFPLVNTKSLFYSWTNFDGSGLRIQIISSCTVSFWLLVNCTWNKKLSVFKGSVSSDFVSVLVLVFFLSLLHCTVFLSKFWPTAMLCVYFPSYKWRLPLLPSSILQRSKSDMTYHMRWFQSRVLICYYYCTEYTCKNQFWSVVVHIHGVASGTVIVWRVVLG